MLWGLLLHPRPEVSVLHRRRDPYRGHRRVRPGPCRQRSHSPDQIRQEGFRRHPTSGSSVTG